MKKRVFLLTLISMGCAKKESPVPATQPVQTTTVQASDALDSTTIAKLVAINPAEPWNSAKAYKAGEVIRFNNETWIAIRPGYQNTPPPDEWFWKKVEHSTNSQPAVEELSAKTDSTKPVSTTSGSSEPYNPDKEYKTGERVQFNGKTFVAKRNVFLNTNPNDSWFWEEK